MRRCSQANCHFSETSVCLEGHGSDCPNLLPEDVNTNKVVDALSPRLATVVEPKRRSFHSGEKLTVFEASRLLQERPASVVLCVGSRDSGVGSPGTELEFAL